MAVFLVPSIVVRHNDGGYIIRISCANYREYLGPYMKAIVAPADVNSTTFLLQPRSCYPFRSWVQLQYFSAWVQMSPTPSITSMTLPLMRIARCSFN